MTTAVNGGSKQCKALLTKAEAINLLKGAHQWILHDPNFGREVDWMLDGRRLADGLLKDYDRDYFVQFFETKTYSHTVFRGDDALELSRLCKTCKIDPIS